MTLVKKIEMGSRHQTSEFERVESENDLTFSWLVTVLPYRKIS